MKALKTESRQETACGCARGTRWWPLLWEFLPISLAAGLFWLAMHDYNFVKSPSLIAPEIDEPRWIVAALIGLASLLLLPFLMAYKTKKASFFLFLWCLATAGPFVFFFGRGWHLLLFVFLFATVGLYLLHGLRFSKILYGLMALLLAFVAAVFMSMSLYEAMCFGSFHLPQVLALVETNTGEFWDYLSKNLFLLAPWGGVPFWVMAMGLPKTQVRAPLRLYLTSEVSLLIGVLLSVAVMCTPPAQRFSAVFKALVIYDSNATSYHDSTKDRLAHLDRLGVVASGKGIKGPLIVVIGESANRNHLGLYGYNRPTSPLLQARGEDISVFDNVVSSYVTTIISLTHALTFASVESGKKYYDPDVPSLIEVLRAGGLDTVWLSNQSEHGFWSQTVSDLAAYADHVLFVREDARRSVLDVFWDDRFFLKTDFDEVLLPRLAGLIKQEKPQVIFVHLMGSHARYEARYPRFYDRFSNEIEPKDATLSASLWAKVNMYDNSLLYTDYIIDDIIRLAEAHGGESAVLYFSDHGESPFIPRDRDPSRLAVGDIEVPFLLWFSPDYKQSHPDVIQIARQRVHAPFMTDQLSQLVVGLEGLSGPFYKPERDLLNEAFQPTERMAYDGTIPVSHFTESYCAEALRMTGMNIGSCSRGP